MFSFSVNALRRNIQILSANTHS